MNTIKEGRFENTNKAFVKPDFYNIEITSWDYDVDTILEQIRLYDR